MARGCLNGEGFQFLYEARRKMLGDDTALVGKDVLENSCAFCFREALNSKSEKSRPLPQM